MEILGEILFWIALHACMPEMHETVQRAREGKPVDETEAARVVAYLEWHATVHPWVCDRVGQRHVEAARAHLRSV